MVEAIPDGSEKDSLRTFVEHELFKRQPDRLLNRLQAMPEGAERDQKIRRYINVMLRSNPEVAYAVAELTSDPRREAEVERVFRAWLRSDPEAAKRALEGSSLPQEKKDFLLPHREQ